MTDRLSDDQLDSQIRDFLAWRAEDVTDAPTAAEMATRIRRPVGATAAWMRPEPRLAWILLALLVGVLLGAAVIGAGFLQHGPPRLSYEAVFLRLEVVDAQPEVIAVGVDREGRERQIARLMGAWVAYDIGGGEGFLAPMGAVSTSGLLAIPRGTAGAMEWEILDLRRPGAQPIVIAGIQQDIEQIQATPYFRFDMRPSVFWGPGERLAIPWYDQISPADPNGSNLNWHVSFVDGLTGAAASVDYSERLVLLPWWAPDGSGVFVGNGGGVIDPPQVLRPDGTLVAGTAALASRSCRTREQSGAEISTLAGRTVRRAADGRSEDVLSSSGVGFACIAPDDSTAVLSMEIGSGTTTAAHPTSRLISLGGGAWHDVVGSFAGWIEVER